MSFITRTIGKLTGRQDQADAAVQAGKTQAAAAQAGADQLNNRFDEGKALQLQQLEALRQAMAPYTNAGTGALTGVQDLTGLNGASAQQTAIAGIQNSPQFAALSKAGSDAILANASATGGLRGGNVQGALGQFQPQLLSQLIDQQLSRLGGLTSLGANSSMNVGNAGLNTAGNIAQEGLNTGVNVGNLLQQKGAATAGGQIAQGSVASLGFGDALKIGALVMGGGGFPDMSNPFSGSPVGAATQARTDLSNNGQYVRPGLSTPLYNNPAPGSIASYTPPPLPPVEIPFLSKF